MSEKADLLQGIRLNDYIRRICPKCKTRAGIQVSLCPDCGKSLSSPIILPSFAQAVESALHYAITGQIGIDTKGEISEILKTWPELTPYLKQSVAITGLDATITYGFPRLLGECDTYESLYKDIEPRLRSIRAFLGEQLKIARRALLRLREQRLRNPLEGLLNQYASNFRDYASEKTKTQGDLGEGHITSSIEKTGKELASVLVRIDTLVGLLGPRGSLWGLFNEHGSGSIAEWDALLQVISEFSNFPLPQGG